MLLTRIVDEVFRNEGRRMLAGLIRLTGDFDAAEDALQEACVRALGAWRRDGLPERPAAWLNTVSRRIAIDRFRRDRTTDLPADLQAEAPEGVQGGTSSRVRAPPVLGGGRPRWPPLALSSVTRSGTVESGDEPEPEPDPTHAIEDDRLRLLFVCCHPALATDARCALALRTLGGLTTREIARAFLEPEATTAQRLVRAKKKIREARIPFEVPPREKLEERTADVLSVLYLIFNEGYTSTDAPSLLRPDLVREAIRLARLAVELLPQETEARGLLALMLLTDARREGRLTPDGELVPLEEQDRSRWNRASIEEGVRVLDTVLAERRPGPYQIQAAIAALHATAPTPESTDWPQIAALYQGLLRFSPTPIVELNAAVALGLATDLQRALDWMDHLAGHPELSRYHRLPEARAEVLRRLGRPAQAAEAYREALRLVTNPGERRHLERRLASCS